MSHCTSLGADRILYDAEAIAIRSREDMDNTALSSSRLD